jgi:hypothetical protein
LQHNVHLTRRRPKSKEKKLKKQRMRRLPYTYLQKSEFNMTLQEISNRTMIKDGVLVNVENRSDNQTETTFHFEELLETNWKLKVEKRKIPNKKNVAVFFSWKLKQIQGHVNCQPICDILILRKSEYENV